MDPNQNPNPNPDLTPDLTLDPSPIPAPQPVGPQVAPAPIAPPVQPPVATPAPVISPVTSSQTMIPPTEPVGPMSQADFLKLAKKQRRPKKLIAIVAGLILLVGVYFTLNALGVLPWAGLKTVKYVNGKGDTYSLKFYAQNKIISVKDSEDWKALVANHGKGGKAPLQISMYDADASKGGTAFTNNMGCGGKTPKLTVHNNYANTDVKICDVSETNEKISSYIYFATFKSHDKITVMLIMQDLDYTNGLKDQKSAQALVDSAGLDVYESDIKTIVASIKTVSK